ncbi:MFS transporter [Allokutzneria albata]|uniref:Predicted arabinose efflux permease, MFS family n=1 Tax=Allokutzneria albata TaxID=211114 RepID=A0A1G9RTF2_ALLAB|nr:MFS transporter [Allokutzneria albata]SDM26257.1 Predicted arabinose efflux permease, MFS family [Allokutzneria albata]
MKLLIDVRPLRASTAFRRLWIGNTASTLGGQLTVVAVLTQVWQLTENPVAVGTIGIVHAVPMVVFGLLGGTLADTVDRRRLVLFTTVGQIVTTALLAAQALLGFASLAVVLGLVGLQSTFSGLGAPARKTFVVRLLPEHLVRAGIALNHISFQAAMLAGPAIAGVITAQWGVATCYVIDAFTFAIGLYGVFMLPSMRPEGEGTRPGPRAIGEGWRFLVGQPVVRGALVTDVVATVFAMPIALFPAIADERFCRPEALGLFMSAIAVGGIAAGAASGLVTRARRPGAVMLAAAGVWGAALAGFGVARPLWIGVACLVIAGAADTISVISRGAIVQIATPDAYRGRVGAVEHIIGVSGPDIGNFRAGLFAGGSSPAFALVSGGALCVAGIAYTATRNRALRRFSTPVEEAAQRA